MRRIEPGPTRGLIITEKMEKIMTMKKALHAHINENTLENINFIYFAIYFINIIIVVVVVVIIIIIIVVVVLDFRSRSIPLWLSIHIGLASSSWFWTKQNKITTTTTTTKAYLNNIFRSITKNNHHPATESNHNSKI
jgi:hypothetical protein